MKGYIKKLAVSVLAFCQIFVMTAYARPDWPSDTGIQAEAGAAMDVDSGTLIFGQNSHVEYPPASITKILTALIVIENADLADTVTYSETAMNSVEADSGNKLSLVAGDTMTVEDSLYALLLASVNQSANALAEHVAGSIPAFVDMMNAKLAELGCTESHFENPSGLNGDSQNVSAYDMAKIACAAYSNETLLKISSTVDYKIGPLTNNPDGIAIQNEHRLVKTEDSANQYYCPEAVAGKTGYLLKAGNTLVTYGEKDGRRVVSVILMGSPKQYFLDGKEILQFALNRFQNVNIAENETRYITGEGAVDLNGTSYDPANLFIEENRVITLPDNATFADADVSLEALPESHPVNAVALLQYSYNDRKIGQAYILDKTIEVPEEAVTVAASVTSAGDEGEDETDEPETEENAGESSAPESQPDTEDGAEGKQGGFSMPEIPVLPVVIGAAALAVTGAIAGVVIWMKNARKKEAEAAAARRERRRQRLSEDGAEEAFNKLLEEKKNRGNNKQQ